MTHNPYQPPASVDASRTRFSRLVKFLAGFPWTNASRFSRGELLIVDGIAFYVDPNDSSLAFAASPSASNTKERMNLIVAEAIRVLPLLLADFPSLIPILRGRKLVVRMLNDYDSSINVVIRVEVLDWDILSAMLDGDSQ